MLSNAGKEVAALAGTVPHRWALVLMVINLALLGTGVGFATARSADTPRGAARYRTTGRHPAFAQPSGGTAAGSLPGGQPSPRPTVTLPARSKFLVGQTATVIDAATSAALQITVGAPQVTSGALGSYGYGPQEGLYLSFPVTVHNSGSVAVVVHVLDFVVDEPTLPDRTVDEGNTPYSGAPRQLDNTVLAPGQQVSNVLTYDEPGRHGRLRWVTGGVTACSWSF